MALKYSIKYNVATDAHDGQASEYTNNTICIKYYNIFILRVYLETCSNYYFSVFEGCVVRTIALPMSAISLLAVCHFLHEGKMYKNITIEDKVRYLVIHFNIHFFIRVFKSYNKNSRFGFVYL